MTRQIVVSPEAEEDIDRIDDWWRAYREKAPDLFAEELGRCFATVLTLPNAGRLQRGMSLPGVRRLTLRKTRVNVFYRLVNDEVHILALSGGAMNAAPSL